MSKNDGNAPVRNGYFVSAFLIFSVPAARDIYDDAGHALVTSYAVKRPDGLWSLLIVNRDQENAHKVSVSFHDADSGRDTSFTGNVDMLTFGRNQYVWDPLRKVADSSGILRKSIDGTNKQIELPAASVLVLRGKVAPLK